jgi:hypothetical protein
VVERLFCTVFSRGSGDGGFVDSMLSDPDDEVLDELRNSFLRLGIITVELFTNEIGLWVEFLLAIQSGERKVLNSRFICTHFFGI